MGNATVKLKKKLWTDSDCNNRSEHTDEAQEAVTKLDDQTIDSAEGRSFKDAWSDDTSTIPLVASLENPQTHDMTPLLGKCSKEKAEHPDFAEGGGVNGTIAMNMVMVSSVSIAGEELVICNTIHKINDAQVERIPTDAGKDTNLISDHSPDGKPRQSKKRKRNQRMSTPMSIIMTRSLCRKTAENADAFSVSHLVGLENSVKSSRVVVRGSNIENPTDRGEGESEWTPCRLRSENLKIKKRSTCEESSALETNVYISPQDADQLCVEKSHLSKKGRKQRSGLTRTTSNSKNFHESARPTLNACSIKAESHSKAAVTKRERKTSRGSTPKLLPRRKLVYGQEITCTPEGVNKTPTSQTLVLRTSRAGRVLLPVMEFWRNQLPIYDADRGVSAIKEGSTIWKVEKEDIKDLTLTSGHRSGKKSRTKGSSTLRNYEMEPADETGI